MCWKAEISAVRSWFPFVALSLVAVARMFAAEMPADSDATAVEQLKALNDRTIIVSRVWLDTEWDQFKQGAEKATWTLGGLWGWRARDQQDWAVRLKVPFVYHRSDEASGHTDIYRMSPPVLILKINFCFVIRTDRPVARKDEGGR